MIRILTSEDISFIIQRKGEYNDSVARIFHCMGSRNLGWSSTSVLGDACEYLDTSQPRMNTPTVGQTLYLVSTNAADTNAGAGGTGARTIQIVYLDSVGLEKSVTVELNGVTPVSLGSGFTAIQYMEVVTIGSNTTSVGDITISSTNGAATVATTFEKITAGGNRSLSGRYKIPANETGYLLQWHVNAIGTTMDCRIRADRLTYDKSLTPNVYHFLDRNFVAAGGIQDSDLHYRRMQAGTNVKISAIPGNAPAGNKLDCDFSLILVCNA